MPMSARSPLASAAVGGFGAGMSAPPAIGGGRVPAAGAGTVLVARRRRT
ncbi:hypothetical protein M8Z33_04885 [Streptomyces sp. ZAF1911]|nr:MULTISPECIES: hypothetical protein [unclassified Streptomyces]MCM1965979.1 hypothetical protein [Streptomyces sp. G1]MCX5126637.1 hypothetical protein [Streptomyces sp. NBC_00347]MCX5300272.1 hypothetical protein [Streptomyces sp. NBC_00193]MDD9376015.1 hypothetical protein [Streptomyces sp. ZAF1911]